MAFAKLYFPALVQHVSIEGRAHYYSVRPLFLPYPLIINRQYEQAMSLFRKEVRQAFKGFVLEKDNSELLLWLMFHPTIQQTQFLVSGTVGGKEITGQYTAAFFSLQELQFACLPALRSYMFIVDPNISKEVQVNKAVKKVLTAISDEEGADFEPKAFHSKKKEWIASISITVRVQDLPFKFNRDNSADLFARLRAVSNFDGATELEKAAQELNARYPSELNRAYFRDDKVASLYHLLFKEGKTPIVIIGHEGVGRHTLVHETLWRYQQWSEAGNNDYVQRIWHLDPNRIISGMSYVGMWQRRLEAILQYAEHPDEDNQHSDKILIDNPVALLRIGKSANNAMTLSDAIRPYLEKRRLQFILIATPGEWGIMQEKDQRFCDLFQVISLEEPDYITAVSMILAFRRRLEQTNGANFTMPAIHELLNFHRRFLRNKPLPGGVATFMQSISDEHRYSTIDVEEVRIAFKAYSGLLESFLDPGQILDQDELSRTLERQLVGQPQAVAALSDVIHLAKAKLNDITRPITTLLFVGPTGVGKTQAAKVLSRYLFGHEDALLRFDMNEYSDPAAISRLTGDFHNPEGLLTGQIKYRPFGILLLDEIEKAHPNVLDLLLQVLDDARLTDNLGQTIDFSNLIILMTSNLGAVEIGAQISLGASIDSASIYRKAIEREFRPEFVNRIDDIIIFNKLNLEHIQGIARMQIQELLRRDGFVRRTTMLNISQSALDWVAGRGFDPRQGGRALRRQIENDLTTLSAEQLLTLNTEQPIILNITLDNDRLIPRITALGVVKAVDNNWLPQLPDFKHERDFYTKLLQQIQRLAVKIRNLEDHRHDQILTVGEEVDWLYFHFKNRLSELEEHINNRVLSTKGVQHSTPLRLKADALGAGGNHLIALLFQRETLKAIHEQYQYGTIQFDGLQSTMIGDFLDVAFLQMTGSYFFRGQADRVAIRFRSYITGLGDNEISFLMDKYESLLQSLDIQYQRIDEQKTLIAENYGLLAMLEGEAGVHLFYLSHQHPLPINVTVTKLGDEEDEAMPNVIVRLYDGARTLTDLRTGFVNAFNISPQELKLLVYAAMAAT